MKTICSTNFTYKPLLVMMQSTMLQATAFNNINYLRFHFDNSLFTLNCDSGNRSISIESGKKDSPFIFRQLHKKLIFVSICDTPLKHLQSTVTSCDTSLHHLQSTVTSCDTPLQHLQSTVTSCDTSLQHLQSTVTSCDTPLHHLQSTVTSCDTPLQHLQSTVTTCDTPLHHLQSTVTSCDTPLQRMQRVFDTNSRSMIPETIELKFKNETLC